MSKSPTAPSARELAAMSDQELHATGLDDIAIAELREATESTDMLENHHPTVIPPCPAWCVYGAGHQYDSTLMDDPSTFTRFHSTTTGGDVGITVEEHNKNGVVSFASPPFVDIWIGGNQADENGASADQARDYARQLLSAADLLDQIQKGASS